MRDQSVTAEQITRRTEEVITVCAQRPLEDPTRGSMRDHQKWYWLKAHGALGLWVLVIPWSPEKEKESVRLNALADAIYPPVWRS